MAAQAKVNNCTVTNNASTPVTYAITKKDFVSGSATFTQSVKFADVYTSDGALHQAPIQVEGDAGFEVYGYKLGLNTKPGLEETIVFKCEAVIIATIKGMLSASWSETDNKTKISIKATPFVDTIA
jgi:hypothetical protein